MVSSCLLLTSPWIFLVAFNRLLLANAGVLTKQILLQLPNARMIHGVALFPFESANGKVLGSGFPAKRVQIVHRRVDAIFVENSAISAHFPVEVIASVALYITGQEINQVFTFAPIPQSLFVRRGFAGVVLGLGGLLGPVRAKVLRLAQLSHVFGDTLGPFVGANLGSTGQRAENDLDFTFQGFPEAKLLRTTIDVDGPALAAFFLVIVALRKYNLLIVHYYICLCQ